MSIIKLSNLPESVSELEILEFLYEFSVAVEDIHLFRNRDGSAIAIIDLKDPDSVEKALQLNDTMMDGGNVIEVTRSNTEELKKHLYINWKDPIVRIDYLPLNFTQNDVEKIFEDIKDFEIRSILMSLNSRGCFSGTAFVEVENIEQAHRALKKNKQFIGSRYIKVHRGNRALMNFADKNSKLIESTTRVYKSELIRLRSSKSSLTSSCSETSNSLKMTTKSSTNKKSTPYECKRPRQTQRKTSNLITISPDSSSKTNSNPRHNYQPPLVDLRNSASNYQTDSSSNLYSTQNFYNSASYSIAPQMMTNVYGQPPNANLYQNQGFNQNNPSFPIYHQHPLVNPSAYNNSFLYQNQNICFSTINPVANVGMIPNVHNQPPYTDLSNGNSSTIIQSQGLVQNYPIISTNTTSTNMYGSYSIDNRAAKTSKRNSSTDTNCYIVVMKRVPINTTVDEVTNFFAPLVPKNVSFLPYINDDVSSGEDVKVSFSTYNDAEAAMKFNGNKIRGREAELLFLSASQKPSN